MDRFVEPVGEFTLAASDVYAARLKSLHELVLRRGAVRILIGVDGPIGKGRSLG